MHYHALYAFSAHILYFTAGPPDTGETHTHTNKQNKDKHLTNCRTRFPEIIQHLQYKELYNATWVSSQSGMESCPSLTSRAWNPFAAESPRGSWWHVNWMLKRLWRCYRMCLRGVNRMVPWAVVCVGAISGTTYSSGIPRRTLPSSSLVGRERESEKEKTCLSRSLSWSWTVLVAINPRSTKIIRELLSNGSMLLGSNDRIYSTLTDACIVIPSGDSTWVVEWTGPTENV